MNETRRYQGSHVYIFDSICWPRKIVLVKNNSIKQTATPGFGRRGNLSFKAAAKKYTKKQTGLKVDYLIPLNTYSPSEAVREPNSVVQNVDVMNFWAFKVEPTDIESRIREHQKTEEGREYQPGLVEVKRLGEIRDLAPEIPGILERHFNLKYKK